MTWRTGLAIWILLLWSLTIIVTLRSRRAEDREILNTITPIALVVVTGLFAEPVITERIRYRRRHHNGEGR